MSAPETNATLPPSDLDGDLFFGRSENKVDDKRRVQIPSTWRRRASLRLLLLPIPKRSWRPGCLMASTVPQFLAMLRDVRQMNFMDDRADSVRRQLLSRAVEVETDSAGRICLPDDQMKAVEIRDRANLVGMGEWFELWSPDRLVQADAADMERPDDPFSLLKGRMS